MIALSFTFKVRESCDQTLSMIALSFTFKACPCAGGGA
jgi:hypothetical protein